jgi:hypothetical protein
MKEWYSTIYKAFIIATVVCFLISFFTTGEASFGSLVTAYSTLTLGIILILLKLFKNVLKTTEGQGILKTIYEIFVTSGPIILLLMIVGFIMFIIINYKTLITSGHVSKSYFSFLNITTLLILLQIYLLFTNIESIKFQTTGKLTKITSGILYLLSIITTACSITIFTILKYFTTDGFMTK